MGGPGSGRFSGRPSTDAALRLDFRPFFRAGLHRARRPWRAPQQWTCRGAVSAEIDVLFDPAAPGRLTLRYLLDGTPVSEAVPVVATATAGAAAGARPWVACPGCGRRCAVLWGVGGRFRCRGCHRLRYAVEAEGPYDRAARQVEGLRRRLGCRVAGESGYVFERDRPPRPPRMPRATYRRLLARLARAEGRAAEAFHDELRRLLAGGG